MSRNDNELEGVSLLGNQGVKYPTDYAPELLETFPNKHCDNEYLVTFNCPEFTTLCPKTGQPDFGKIIIKYTTIPYAFFGKNERLIDDVIYRKLFLAAKGRG